MLSAYQRDGLDGDSVTLDAPFVITKKRAAGKDQSIYLDNRDVFDPSFRSTHCGNGQHLRVRVSESARSLIIQATEIALYT